MLLVPVQAYDTCWFFGDDFTSRTFEQYFKARISTEYNGYVKAHFDIKGFFNNFISSDNPSLISRLGNLVNSALTCDSKRVQPLPKIIVIVLDADLFKCVQNVERDVTKSFNRLLNYVMTEHERAVASFKEYLPAKSL